MPYDVFDEYYSEYDSWFNRRKKTFYKELDCFKSIIDSQKPWLEIGVGTGRFASALGIDYGVDPSEKMLRLAKMRGIKVFKAFGENLPFKDSTFGAVFIIVTLCFADDPEKMLFEAHRVLKNKGKLYLGIIPLDTALGKFYMHKKFHGHKFYSRARFYSFGEIIKLLNNAGFAVTKMRSAKLDIPDFYCFEAVKDC